MKYRKWKQESQQTMTRGQRHQKSLAPAATLAAAARRPSLAAPIVHEPATKPARKPISLNSHYATKPKYILTEETKEYLRSPSFDNWAWDENELFGLFEFMFEDLGLIEAFKMDVQTLRKFLVSVRDSYNNNVCGFSDTI
ncbi:hypothetical protein BDR26DRAFT_892002 [Obelidium mucronatum]|nr:hypothetical protein BDR26DRAFT_892002 [Obelidium mucronatum]